MPQSGEWHDCGMGRRGWYPVSWFNDTEYRKFVKFKDLEEF